MSGRPCISCGRDIPAGVFAEGEATEVFCPWCAASQAPAPSASEPAVSVAAGHPKVRRTVAGEAITYQVRTGSCFGWFWLIFTIVHCGFMFFGMSQGNVRVNGQLVDHPAWWFFLLLGLFYVPFFLIGFAFTLARYTLTLTPAGLRVRWRVVPWVGWTWELPAGPEVRVRQQFRGSSENGRPVPAIVVASQGKEIDFGSFLAKDIKAFLVAAIRDYYGEPASGAADFIG